MVWLQDFFFKKIKKLSLAFPNPGFLELVIFI